MRVNKDDIYIAGLGVVTAIGNNAAECLLSFENEEAGMGAITQLNTIHRNVLPVAEVKLTNEELARLTGLPDDISRTTLLGLLAAKDALNDADIPELSSLRVGFVSANTDNRKSGYYTWMGLSDFMWLYLKNYLLGSSSKQADVSTQSISREIEAPAENRVRVSA